MKKTEILEEEIKELIKDYLENFIGSDALGVKYGLTKRRVLSLLDEYNIPKRKSGRLDLGGVKEANKRYHKKNRVKRLEYFSGWGKQNREHLRTYHKEWRTENADMWRKTKRNYEKKRKSEDPLYKLIGNFRTSIYTVLKENDITKCGHYFNILGYTQEELINHLESQFKDGITWENYGEWHVDHKLPITSFEFKNVTDIGFKDCWSLNNLQPLWGSENIIKSNKIM